MKRLKDYESETVGGGSKGTSTRRLKDYEAPDGAEVPAKNKKNV